MGGGIYWDESCPNQKTWVNLEYGRYLGNKARINGSEGSIRQRQRRHMASTPCASDSFVVHDSPKNAPRCDQEKWMLTGNMRRLIYDHFVYRYPKRMTLKTLTGFGSSLATARDAGWSGTRNPWTACIHWKTRGFKSVLIVELKKRETSNFLRSPETLNCMMRKNVVNWGSRPLPCTALTQENPRGLRKKGRSMNQN